MDPPGGVVSPPLGGAAAPVVIAPSRFSLDSANHILLSGPATIPSTPAFECATGYSWISEPEVAVSGIEPIASALRSVNHIWPSGPAAIPNGRADVVGVRNSVIVPVGVILPTAEGEVTVNHRFPSGPSVMPSIPLALSGSGNSSPPECAPFVAIRSIRLPAPNHSRSPGPEVTPEIAAGEPVSNNCTVPVVVAAPICSSSPIHSRPSGPVAIEPEPPEWAPDPYS